MHVHRTTEVATVAETIIIREEVDVSTRTNVTTIIVRTAGVETVTDALVVEEAGARITVDSMVDHMTVEAVGVIIKATRIIIKVGETEAEGATEAVGVTRKVITNNHNNSNNNDILVILLHRSTGNVHMYALNFYAHKLNYILQKRFLYKSLKSSKCVFLSFTVSHSSKLIKPIQILTNNHDQLILRPPINNNNKHITINNKPNRTITSKRVTGNKPATVNILDDIDLSSVVQ